MSKSRRYCFTLNNYTEDNIGEIFMLHSVLKFGIFGKEVGKLGTPHLQGFIIFKENTKFKTVINRYLPFGCHVELCKGSIQQNIDYCMKEKNYYFFGKVPEQGKREDLNEIRDIMNNGGRVVDIVRSEIHLNYQSLKYAESLSKYQKLEKRDVPIVYWIHGKPGSGKTRGAITIAEEDYDGDYWISSGRFDYLEGYYGQKCVILDELRMDSMPFQLLLRMIDRYPFRVNLKGSSVPFKAECIIITSIYNPKEFITNEEDKNQLKRRITRVIEAKKVPEVGGNTKAPDSDKETLII